MQALPALRGKTYKVLLPVKGIFALENKHNYEMNYECFTLSTKVPLKVNKKESFYI